MNKKLLKAFTLAEVLITLGIIGVVAAITMPMLIANYQKTVIVNQLKKSYSMWNQVFQKILADEHQKEVEASEKLAEEQSVEILNNNVPGNFAAGRAKIRK